MKLNRGTLYWNGCQSTERATWTISQMFMVYAEQGSEDDAECLLQLANVSHKKARICFVSRETFIDSAIKHEQMPTC